MTSVDPISPTPLPFPSWTRCGLWVLWARARRPRYRPIPSIPPHPYIHTYIFNNIFQANPSLAVVNILLEAYPQAASVRDSHRRIPLMIALDKEQADVAVVAALLHAYPEGPSQTGQHGRLCLHMALERSSPREDVVRMLAKAYPEGVLIPFRSAGPHTRPHPI